MKSHYSFDILSNKAHYTREAMIGYRVRKALVSDIPVLIDLLKRTDLFWEVGDTVEVFTKKLEFDSDSILVLILQEKIIGMALITYDPWASFIWHLVIEPTYQKMGLGHLLAEEAESCLRRRGTTSVNAYVLPTNRDSLSFFRKRGFMQFPSSVIPIEKVL